MSSTNNPSHTEILLQEITRNVGRYDNALSTQISQEALKSANFVFRLLASSCDALCVKTLDNPGASTDPIGITGMAQVREIVAAYGLHLPLSILDNCIEHLATLVPITEAARAAHELTTTEAAQDAQTRCDCNIINASSHIAAPESSITLRDLFPPDVAQVINRNVSLGETEGIKGEAPALPASLAGVDAACKAVIDSAAEVGRKRGELVRLPTECDNVCPRDVARATRSSIMHLSSSGKNLVCSTEEQMKPWMATVHPAPKIRGASIAAASGLMERVEAISQSAKQLSDAVHVLEQWTRRGRNATAVGGGSGDFNNRWKVLGEFNAARAGLLDALN